MLFCDSSTTTTTTCQASREFNKRQPASQNINTFSARVKTDLTSAEYPTLVNSHQMSQQQQQQHRISCIATECASSCKRRTTTTTDKMNMIAPIAAAASILLLLSLSVCSCTGDESAAATNYLLYSNPLRVPDAQLDDLLRDSNHSHVSDAVSLKLAQSVWTKMRQNALRFAQDRARQIRPAVRKLIEAAEISAGCSQSIEQALDHLANLDYWAVQMYNAFGDFPATGLFEGTLTSMGSYEQCVNLDDNQYIGKAQYCTFKFQPIVPKRPKYHNILAVVDKLANFTNSSDMFHHLANKAQYFYYTKLRLATCMPSTCQANDLERLGKQVAINTYLQYSGFSCLQKEVGFNPDGAQILAIVVLISLASISFLGTFVHLTNLKSLFEPAQDSGKRSGPSKNLALGNHQVVVGEQSQKSLMLPNNMLEPPTMAKSKPAWRTISKSQMLYTVEVLLHFSIVKNAKKLFDTSTSRHSNQRPVAMLSSALKDSSRASSTRSSQLDGSSSDDANSIDEPQAKSTNEISCVHGLRFWTISWIIFGHTMQYTEWAGFARAFQVEQNIVSFYLQPLLNATFSVDTFFLISGLLTTYVTWSITRGEYRRFNKFAFLISRYLRLTPQVLLVILLFIVFPMMGDGPYWRGLIQKESDNCKRNWWVSALYLQAFMKQDQICNLVTWWLSIEMFYHFVSIIVVIALLHSARKGLLVALAIGGGLTGVSCYLHYVNSYPPNMLPTLLQRYEVWDSIVLKFFWTPYPHAAAYFVGLLLGYALYNRTISRLSRRQVRLGWFAFVVCYLTILFGTYRWNNNAPYERITSTVFYNACQLFWSLSTGWAILACALGHGGWLNRFLSSPVFVPLGRATYMTYLSHMLIVMSYPAKMNLLIEPSYVVFLYIFISNLFLSYMLGICLTLIYESPILHLQKLIVTNMASKFNEDSAASQQSRCKLNSNHNNNNNNIINNNHSDDQTVRVSLYTQQEAVISEDCNRLSMQ